MYMEAHQYKIRIEKSQIESLDFNINDISLNNVEIRIIKKNIANDIIVEYEWLKTMPHIVRYCFGIYFKLNDREILGGVLTFGDDYAENTGVWMKYGFEDKLLLLNRGVCLWWTPPNTASFFISRACKWIKKHTKYRIITATIDPAAGEIGTIYQALNWHYTGVMSGNYQRNREISRFGVLIDGKLRNGRWCRRKFGTMRKDVILSYHPNAEFIQQYRKRRYFYFMGSKSRNNNYYKAIKHLIQTYPKRYDDPIIGIIYMAKNKINNKIYIGQTTRAISERIGEYKKGLGNQHINNAINKYGWDNLEFTIIDSANTINELNNKEIQYIKQYNSNNKDYGYNIETGGKNSIPNFETKIKMSQSHIGIKQDDTWINKRISSAGSVDAKKYGKNKTDYDKMYLSNISPKFWQGKKRDDTTITKIKETKKIIGLSEKQKNIIFKTVHKINISNNEIITYDSTQIASTNESVHQSTISRWCKSQRIVNGFQWKY